MSKYFRIRLSCCSEYDLRSHERDLRYLESACEPLRSSNIKSSTTIKINDPFVKSAHKQCRMLNGSKVTEQWMGSLSAYRLVLLNIILLWHIFSCWAFNCTGKILQLCTVRITLNSNRRWFQYPESKLELNSEHYVNPFVYFWLTKWNFSIFVK